MKENMANCRHNGLTIILQDFVFGDKIIFAEKYVYLLHLTILFYKREI